MRGSALTRKGHGGMVTLSHRGRIGMSEHPHGLSAVSGHLTGQLSQVYIFISMLSQCFCQALRKYNLHAVKMNTLAVCNLGFLSFTELYTHCCQILDFFLRQGIATQNSWPQLTILLPQSRIPGVHCHSQAAFRMFSTTSKINTVLTSISPLTTLSPQTLF